MKRFRTSVLSIMMLSRVTRRFVIALTSLAFLAGSALQAAPPSMASIAVSDQTTSIPVSDCAEMAADTTSAPVPMKMPCQGMTPECVKAMGCIGLLALPLHSAQVGSPICYGRVIFSSRHEVSQSLGIEPLLFPPRSA